MSSEYSHQVLKVCVAQICQNLGWNSTQSTPLELLTDILERYLLEVGKVTHRYSEQFGRTEPTIDDIGLAFRHLNVCPSELGEYIKNADPVPYAHDVIAFPVPKKNNLQFPKPDCREVVTRDEHIPEYMPLMHPELEEEEPADSATTGSDTGLTGLSQLPTPSIVTPTPTEGAAAEKHTLTPPDGPPYKRRRLDSTALPEEAGPSLYEMKSITISTSGDLTPTRGKTGKLPDPRTPPSGYPKKKDSPKTSPVKISKKPFEKPESNKERIERDLFSETVSIQSSYEQPESSDNVQVEIVRPKSAVISPPGYDPRSPGLAKSPKRPGRPPGRPPKSPGRPPLKKSPGRPPMQRSPGRPPLSRSPGRSPFQRSPGRPPLHRSPSRPHSGRSPGRPPKSPRGRPRGFMPVVVRPNPPADIEKIEREILERMSSPSQTSNDEVPATPTADQPMDLSFGKTIGSPVQEVVVKTEQHDENSQEAKLVIVEQTPRPRGRPPKKVASPSAIDDVIQSVIEKSNEESKEAKLETISEGKESKTEIKQESNDQFNEGESFDAYVTNVNLDDISSDVISEVTIQTDKEVKSPSDSSSNNLSITLPSGDKLPPIPPPLLGSPTKRPKGRPKGSGKKKITPVKEKVKLKQKVLSETISEVNIIENKPTVKSEPSEKKPAMDPWMAAMSAAGLAVTVHHPEPEEDTMPASVEIDTGEMVEVGNEIEAKTETVKVKSEPLDTSKDENKVKDKSEKSKEHKRKKEKKKKNKNKDRDKEKSKKDKSREVYFPKLKIKLGGHSSTCESIMSPRPESSPSESPRQEGLKLVIKTVTQMSSSETKPSSPSVKKETKTKPDVKKESIVKPGIVIEEEPPVLTPEPPKTATPPPPVLKAPSPVHRKNPSPLSIPQLPGVVPSPPPPNLSQPPTSTAQPTRRHDPSDHHEAHKFPSPAPTETKSSPARTPSSPSSSPPHPPESPVEQVNSPHDSGTPSTSPYHSPSPSPGPSNTREIFELPPMPPPSIIPPPPPPSKPAVQRTVVAETIGTFIDATGQKVWICPTCKMPDDGSPMIGCDICDDWYHWVCVGIVEDPPEDQSWYCAKCLAPTKKPSKRGRKKGSGVGRGRGKKLA